MEYKRSRNKVFFGTRRSDNENVYLSLPTWDCEWYWSFGYLENSREHYHLDGYKEKDGMLEHRNICMYDALIEDYDLNGQIKEKLWEFCELALTAYSLKQYAEVCGRGGPHMTTNPCSNTIINKNEAARINNEVLPEIFTYIEKSILKV